MRRLSVTAALAISLAFPSPFARVAAQGGEADVRLMAVAKYVVLGYDVGDRFASEFDHQTTREITPADRKAYAEVRALLVKWRRYVLVDRPGDAELLIGVRVGKHVSVGGGTQVDGRRPASDPAGQSVQVSAPEDMLTVRGASGALLWRQRLSNGLSGPLVPLFERLRSAVEAVAKRP